MSDRSFWNPVHIRYGPGIRKAILEVSAGRPYVLLTGPFFAESKEIDILERDDSLVAHYTCVSGYPDMASVKAVSEHLHSFEFEWIIALGGGSVIDTAKTVAAILAVEKPGWLAAHLENGEGFPEPFDPKPIIACPTTTGSGSEVTMWATIWDFEGKKKYSLSHPKLYPHSAFCDPELSLSLLESETVSTALDALSHSMEAVWNKNHNPISDTLALSATRLILQNLPLLLAQLKNLKLRSDLMTASLMAGLAISGTKTALAHAISYPLTTMFGISHGIACALPLPAILRWNGRRAPERVGLLSEALGFGLDIEALAADLENFFKSFGISLRLSSYGIDEAQLSKIQESAATSGRADNNIINTDPEDLKGIICSLL